jgi:hypothetical protein
MRPDHRNNFSLLEKAFGQLISKKVGTAPDFIGLRNFLKCAILVIHRISPNKITEQSSLRYFLDSVNVLDILELQLVKKYGLQFRGNSAMNAQEFAVNETGQRKAVEHTHDTVVDFLVVLAETLIMN